MLHGHDPFFSSYINYPSGVNLLTNTGAPLLGLLSMPITLLWGPIASYNVMMTLGLAASATSGYVFISHWVRWKPAAFLGGLLYGFSPYEIAQGAGHLNLVFVPVPPMILLCLYKLATHRGSASRNGLLLGGLIVAQFFISTEVLADTAVIALIGLVLLAVAGREKWRSYLPHAAIGIGVGGGLAAVLLAYPVWFALAGPASISGPIQLIPQAYRADLLGPIIPTNFQLLAPAQLVHISSNFAGNPVENGSYLGVPLLLVLSIGTIYLWRRSDVRVCAIMGA